MINDVGISNLYHYTYGRTVKSRFFVKRNPALFIELPSPRFISRAQREKGREKGATVSLARARLRRTKEYMYVSIYRYTRYDILLERATWGIKYEEGIRGRYLLNGDVNNAGDSTSDSISCSIARPVSGVSVLPRTIEARIDSVPGGAVKGYKTYRCLILSDASGVDATKQIAMVHI